MYNDIFPSEPERNGSETGAERSEKKFRSGAERSEKKFRSSITAGYQVRLFSFWMILNHQLFRRQIDIQPFYIPPLLQLSS